MVVCESIIHTVLLHHPPTFIGNDGRIKLSYTIRIFVGDQFIRKGEMEGSEEEEVSMKELKETVMFLVKQLAELKGAFSKTASVTTGLQ